MALIVSIPELAGLSYTFDLLGVDYAPTSVLTRHPVEVGAEVTDHIQRMPISFVARVIVTNSPLLVPAAGIAVDNAIFFLEKAEGRLLTVTVEGDGVWASMALERWPHSKTAMDGRAFDLTFTQIRIALGASIIIPPRMPAPIAQTGQSTEANLNTQAPVPAAPSSTLFLGADAAGDLATNAAQSFGSLFGF